MIVPLDSIWMVSHEGTTIDALNSHPSSSAYGATDVAVRLVEVRKTYGEVVAVERLSLEVRSAGASSP